MVIEKNKSSHPMPNPIDFDIMIQDILFEIYETISTTLHHEFLYKTLCDIETVYWDNLKNYYKNKSCGSPSLSKIRKYDWFMEDLLKLNPMPYPEYFKILIDDILFVY